MTLKDQKLFAQYLQEIPDESEAFTAFERHKALTDLYYFGSEIMGWKNASRGRRKRLQPALHKWFADELQKDDDMLALIARLHLKTTWVKLRMLQTILQNPMIRIAFVSETATLVEAGLRDLKTMAASEAVRSLFPEHIPDPGDQKHYPKWDKSTGDELTICRSEFLQETYGRPPAEPQIMAIGVGRTIQGLHFDIAFVDDIIGPKTVTTQDQLRKTEDWWAYFQSIMEIDAPIIMTGTFYHHMDIYNKIIAEKQFDRIFRRPAVEGGKILYSNWFNKKDLEKIRKRQGDYIFNCQYLLNPIPDSQKMFKPPYPTYEHLRPGKYKRYIAIDPKGESTDANTDDCGVAVGAVDERDNVYIEEVIGTKLTYDPKAKFSFSDFLINLVMKYNPLRVGMEMGLLNIIRFIVEAKVTEWENDNQETEALASLHNIVPIPISRTKSKQQRINLSFGAFIREGRLWIREDCRDLKRQMSVYSGRKSDNDDLLDAVALLFYLHDRFAQHYWIEPAFRDGGPTYRDAFFTRQPEDGWRSQFIS